MAPIADAPPVLTTLGKSTSTARRVSRFDEMTRISARLLGVKFGAIVVAGNSGIQLWSKEGLGREDEPLIAALCAQVVATGEPIAAVDARDDARLASHQAVIGAPHVRYFLAAPFHSSDGARMGAFCLFDDRVREHEAERLELVIELAGYIEREIALSAELRRASEVQQALLPTSTDPLPGYDVAGVCLPAKSVGGDFFDWYPIAGGLSITLGDVMGKGLGAGLIAATVRAIMRSAAGDENVAVALSRTAETLETDLSAASSFVTLFHGRLTAKDGHISFIDAGHGLSVVIRADGSSRRLSSSDLPLGVARGDRWTKQRVVLHHDDTLVTFSDGVLDLFDGTLASVGKVADIAREASSPRGIVDAITALTIGVNTPDDVTVVAVRRR